MVLVNQRQNDADSVIFDAPRARLNAHLRTRKLRRSTAILSILALAALLLHADSFARAQSGSTAPSTRQTRSTLTVEEASGSSLRDFDAIRALDRRFLDNPDGGAVPVDPDDLWLPDLSLGRKAAPQTSAQRMITYGADGKVDTQTRTTQRPANAIPAATQPKANIKQTNATTQNTAPSRVRVAALNAPANAPNAIRQTQALQPQGVGVGFADYAASLPATGGGFADYQIDGARAATVAMDFDQAPQNQNVVTAHETAATPNIPATNTVAPMVEAAAPVTTSQLELFPNLSDFDNFAPLEDLAAQPNAAPDAAIMPERQQTRLPLYAAPTSVEELPLVNAIPAPVDAQNSVQTAVDSSVTTEPINAQETVVYVPNVEQSAQTYAVDATSAFDFPTLDVDQSVVATPEIAAIPNVTTTTAPAQSATLRETTATTQTLTNVAPTVNAEGNAQDPAVYVAQQFEELPPLDANAADAAAIQQDFNVSAASSADLYNGTFGVYGSYGDVDNSAELGLDLPDLESYETFSDHTVDTPEEETFRESFRVTPEKNATQNYLDQVVGSNALDQPQNNEQPLETTSLTEAQMNNLIIEDVRISGLEMSAQQFNKIIKTRIGARFNQQRLEEDKRALIQTKQFIDVSVSTTWSADNPDKVVVNFDLTPRRMMRYIKVVGNRRVSKHDILDEIGMRPGESRMDPYEVENGRIRIIELYKSKEYPEPYVEILRGDRADDVGVVYLIDEGVKQKIYKTTFVGNSAVSSARLKSLVTAKPGFLYVIGGKFSRARLDADVETLLEYYRQLGYFDARIDREYKETSGFAGLGKDNAWIVVRYIIDEGPRYRVRNFYFNGNRVCTDAQLKETLKVKPGSYYNYASIESDRIALRYKYQDLGYVRADITPNQVFTDEVGVIDIRYDVVEDHRYRLRDVIVDYVGSESRTMTSVILNMIDLTPGQVLNGKKIRMSENTLRGSGYFNDKAEEGQLPEIMVVPDESHSYTPSDDKNDRFIREARKPESEQENAVERGQAPSKVNTTRIERGQSYDVDTRRASYTPYDQTVAQQQDKSRRFISYGPSGSTLPSVTHASSATTVAPAKPVQTPFTSFSSSAAVVRGQTRQIPSGFSEVSTQSSVGRNSAYQPYNSGASLDNSSQYSDNLNYANYETSNLLNSNLDSYGATGSSSRSYLSTDYDSAPGFSDGVYGSIARDVLEPITPEQDEIYDGDVLIKVQEGRTGMFQASVGVNSDYGLVGNVSFTERNFDLFRIPRPFFHCGAWKDAFRGGGQIFNVQASPGTSVQSYRVSWDVPYVFDTKNTFGVTGLYGDHSYDEWFEARYGGEIRLGRQWTPRFGTTLNAGIYNVKIKDPAVGFCEDLNDVLGTNHMYTVGLSAAYDTRNHPYTPSAGFLVRGTLEQALGDYNFPRASIDGRYYKTLHSRLDQSGRWVLGLSTHAAWTGDKTPIYERYYGGGSGNLRGFEYREVTPRYLNTGFGVGGNFEFYNTAELLIPVSGGDAFQLALFVDSGTVAKKIDNWGRYRVAPGVGLRFSIPMLGPAPLALDFAFPVSKDPNDVTEVFSFSMSGSR
ncbi:MAG: BamA/TamA family outer membrane protein [Planctomycetia bacterium]|nr:BamA/TamA family outer membrane protein [Planctomycetia bacterium]